MQLRDVAVRALPTVLAVAMNAGASTDIAALGNFVPADREFAIAIDGAKVITEMINQIRRPKADGGLGGVPPPNVDLDPIDGQTSPSTGCTSSCATARCTPTAT